MPESKHPLIIFLTILAFFTLTIIATIRYNGNTEQVEKINSQWRPVVGFITTQSLRLMRGSEKPVNNNQVNVDSDFVESSLSTQGPLESFRYINLFKDELGWHFILQNKERVILEKNW